MLQSTRREQHADELTDATVVEPALVESALVEPALVKPALVDPGLVESALVESAMVEPALVESALVEPAMVGLVKNDRRHVKVYLNSLHVTNFLLRENYDT